MTLWVSTARRAASRRWYKVLCGASSGVVFRVSYALVVQGRSDLLDDGVRNPSTVGTSDGDGVGSGYTSHVLCRLSGPGKSLGQPCLNLNLSCLSWRVECACAVS